MAKSGLLQNVLVFGGLAAAGWFGYRQLKAHGIKQMAVGTANLKVRIDGFTNDGDGYWMNVDILNPNSANLDIQSFVGDMNVNGKKVGDIQMFGDYNVKGNSQLKIPLNVKPLVSVFKAALQSLKKGSSKISFNGTINVNNHAIPLLISYTV